MNDVQVLLARCRELGAELTPTPHGTLKMKAPAPLPQELQEELKQRKAEVLALLTQQSPPWPCPQCGGQVQLEAPEAALLPTRLWTCPKCRAWGATRDGAVYPVVWVSSATVQ